MSPNVTIPKRKLGKTGLEITVLGMGGAPLGGLFQVHYSFISISIVCQCPVVHEDSIAYQARAEFGICIACTCMHISSKRGPGNIACQSLGSQSMGNVGHLFDRCQGTCTVILLQDLSDEQGAEAVREAFKQGINFFDTSPYYGVTRSETVHSCDVPVLYYAYTIQRDHETYNKTYNAFR